MDKKKFTDTGDGAIRVTAQYDGTSLRKNGDQGPVKSDEGPVENRVYVSNDNKVGSYVGEDEFEASFSQKKGDASTHPQSSVEDYSKVKSDSKGGKYVEKL